MEQVDPRWRKASYSGEGANCVEAGNAPGTVLIRDTMNRHGGMLQFTAAAWNDLVAGVQAGKFDTL